MSIKAILLIVLLAGCVLGAGYLDKPTPDVGATATGYFRHVPEDKIHTMRVYEDGSFNIEYKDGTSEVGCLPNGLCED